MQDQKKPVRYLPMFYDGRTPGSMQVWLEQELYTHDLDDYLSYEDALNDALALLNASEYMEDWEQKMRSLIAVNDTHGSYNNYLYAIIAHAQGEDEVEKKYIASAKKQEQIELVEKSKAADKALAELAAEKRSNFIE